MTLNTPAVTAREACADWKFAGELGRFEHRIVATMRSPATNVAIRTVTSSRTPAIP